MNQENDTKQRANPPKSEQPESDIPLQVGASKNRHARFCHVLMRGAIRTGCVNIESVTRTKKLLSQLCPSPDCQLGQLKPAGKR